MGVVYPYLTSPLLFVRVFVCDNIPVVLMSDLFISCMYQAAHMHAFVGLDTVVI